MKKNHRLKTIMVTIIVLALAASLFVKLTNNKPTPTELKTLREEIKQNNQGQNFDLDYEYTGPNTHQPLPFNYE